MSRPNTADIQARAVSGALVDDKGMASKGFLNLLREELLRRFWSPVPEAANSPGEFGQVAFDAGFFYICVATNTWRRVAIVAW